MCVLGLKRTVIAGWLLVDLGVLPMAASSLGSVAGTVLLSIVSVIALITGILYDTSLGAKQLAAQAIGVLVLCTVIFGIAFAFFKIQNALTKGGIRSSEEDELAGLDIPEMGALAYPEFHLHEGEVSGHGGGSPTMEDEFTPQP